MSLCCVLAACAAGAPEVNPDGWPMWPITSSDTADPRVVTVDGAHFVTGTDWQKMEQYDADWTNATHKTVQLGQSFWWNGTYYGVPAWSFTPYQGADGKWGAYFTGNEAAVLHCSPRNASDVWTADKPITSWTTDGMLFKGGTYDNEVKTDENGKMWLITNVGAGGDIEIVAVPMDNATTMAGGLPDHTVPREKWVTLLTADHPKKMSEFRDPPPYTMSIVESVHVFHVNGVWALLYSVGDYALGNYKVGVAYSPTLIGQYKKQYYNDIENVWGNDIAQTGGQEVRYLMQTWNAEAPGYVARWANAPGIASFTETTAGPAMIFHARVGEGPRQLWLMPYMTHAAGVWNPAAQDPTRPFVTIGGLSAPTFSKGVLAPEFQVSSARAAAVTAANSTLVFTAGSVDEGGLFLTAEAEVTHTPLQTDLSMEATFTVGAATAWGKAAYVGFVVNSGERTYALQRNETSGAADVVAFSADQTNRMVGTYGAVPAGATLGPVALRLIKDGAFMNVYFGQSQQLLLRERWTGTGDALGGVLDILALTGGLAAAGGEWTAERVQVQAAEIIPYNA